MKLPRYALNAILPALCLLAAGLAGAAEPLAGERIRLKDPVTRRWMTGNLIGVSADTLVLRTDAAHDPERRLPVAAVERLQVSRGSGGNFGKGVLFGGLSGLVLGLVGNAAADDGPGNLEIISDEGAVAMGVIALAVVGGVIGLVVRTEKWQDATLPSVAFVPTLGGAAVALTLAW